MQLSTILLPPLSMPIVARCPQMVSSPATTCLCCSSFWFVVEWLSAACFYHQTLWCNCQHFCCWLLLLPIVNHFSQVVWTPAAACSLLLLSLVGCCIVICWCCPLLSSHPVVRPSSLLLLALVAANHQPMSSGSLVTSHCPPLLLLLLVGCCIFVRRHCMPLCGHQCSCYLPLLLPIIDCCSQAVLSPAATHL